jgi:PAS domain S-box-containing protein
VRETSQGITEVNVPVTAEMSQQILDSSDDCIKMLDLEGRILFISQGGQALLCIQDVTPFLHTSWIEFWEGADQQAAIAAIVKAKAGEVCTFQGYRPTLTGEPKWWDCKLSPIRNAEGQIERLLCISRDITARKRSEDERQQAEERLRKNEEHLSAIFSQAAVGFAEISLDGHFQRVNNELCRILGRSRTEMLATRIFDITHPEDVARSLETFEALVQTGQPVVLDKRYLHPNGAIVWANSSLTRIDDEQDQPRSVLAVTVDLSDRKQAEEIARRTAAFNAFRVSLTDALRSLADPVEIQAAASRVLGEYLGANRVAYFEVRGADYVVERDYVNGVAALVGSYSIESFGPRLLAAYRTGHAVSTVDVTTDPNLSSAQRAAYAAIQIGAYIGIPLIKGGEFVAGLAVHMSNPRSWTSDEITLTEEVAERTWAAVERARAEAALRKSEEKYRSLFNSMDEGFCLIKVLFDETGKAYDYCFLEANSAFEKHTGLVGAVGKTMRELVPQHDAHWFEIYGEIVLTGKPARFENAARELGRFFDVYAFRIDEPHEHKVAVLFNNISDRKQAEATLRASEERLQRAIAIGTVGVIFFNANGNITDANDAFLHLSGYSRADVVQGLLRWDVLIPPEWMPQSLKALEELETTGRTTPHEKEYIRKDGSRWWGLFAATRLNATESVEFIIDVSDRKRIEGSLRQSESRFRLVVESAKDYAIFTLDLNRLVTSWNSGAERLLGYTEAEIVGRSGDLIFTPEDVERERPQREMELALTQGRAENERWHVCKDGSRFWGSGLVMPLRDEAGTTQGVVKIMQDKTTQRQAEAEREQLLQREQSARSDAERANHLKDEFLAVLSHELRSPLNPILGWSKLLQNRNLGEAKTRQALQTIERNAQLQAELIEDLLDVSRILQGKLSLTVNSINLAIPIRAAMETVRLAAEAKSIQIQATLDHEVESVVGDATRLQQVVWNLLSNAVKFTPIGGRVDVRLEQIGSWEPEVESLEAAPIPAFAQITISDNGRGIDSDFLPHVFDYFRQEDGATTRKFGGLGLGLAIVRQIVELHGGTVGVESQGEGLGATFTVRLPLVSRTENPELRTENLALGSQPPTLSTPLAGLQILVVDDDADSLDFIAFVVEQAGATVRTATSGVEAIATLMQSPVDILLSDVGMPDMDGYMLMRQVKLLPPEQGGQVKAIALTAYAGDFNQQQALQAGFQQHVAKPVEPEVLVKAISALCSS